MVGGPGLPKTDVDEKEIQILKACPPHLSMRSRIDASRVEAFQCRERGFWRSNQAQNIGPAEPADYNRQYVHWNLLCEIF